MTVTDETTVVGSVPGTDDGGIRGGLVPESVIDELVAKVRAEGVELVRTVGRGPFRVLGDEASDGVPAQRGAAGTGEERDVGLAVAFGQPGFEHGDGLGGQRR
ncbi:hypothetical protein K6U06_23735 [Acidiferrimicrobium sp. IK]|nr:hypothetical protein [Acidiferrimicrobium sp. IK]MCU4187392.1 hypothetical protein [Acidiferrimicrobium sp. IK]